MALRSISLDIRTDLMHEVDLSALLQLSEIHAINNHRFKKYLDPIVMDRQKIDLSLRTLIDISRFQTPGMLDLALPEILAGFSVYRSGRRQYYMRSRTVNLVPPLQNIPYGALDVRKEEVIPKKHIYADLFRRSLPHSLSLRRKTKQVANFFERKKYPILIGFFTVLMILLPAIWYVRYSVEHAYERLLSLQYAENIGEMQGIIRDAKRDFERAEFLFFPFSWIPHETIDLADRAIRGGRELTKGIDLMLATIPLTTGVFSPTITEGIDASNYRSGAKDIFLMDGLGVSAPTDWLTGHQSSIFSGIDAVIAAGNVYKEIDSNGKLAEQMKKVGLMIEFTGDLLAYYKKHAHTIHLMLGSKDPQRYLIFNQNRDEIRANGGFPGSIISFTLYKGNILDYRTDDVYYYDWNLYPHQETPPPGIALLTDNYGLRDVNYYPDFRMTLDKANRFVERSGDPTLSTAIAIHQGIVEDILEIMGPISLSGVAIPFDADNFSLLMSVLVEHEFARDKTPKDILFTFIKSFVESAIKSDRFTDILDIVREYLNRGEVLFASRNDSIQQFLDTLTPTLPWKCNPLLGEHCSKNWIYPVFTSVSGNKSDRYIARSIEVETKRIEQCLYENTINLSFEHQYNESDRENLEILMTTFGITDREKMRFIQGNGMNRNFIRYYVPTGVELIGSGATIEHTDDATVLSFMLETDVGARSTKTIQYRIPISQCHTYTGTIDIVRQPGLRNFSVQ